MFDNLFNDDKEEAEKGFYEIREHQDNTYQFCPYCNDYREFLYDRCISCKNN